MSISFLTYWYESYRSDLHALHFFNLLPVIT
jgi:hypothetical protein